MQPHLLLVNIKSDGMGDLSHFLDILEFLKKNPKTQQYQYIPIICVEDLANNKLTQQRFERVKQKLAAKKIEFYYLGNNAAYKTYFANDSKLIQYFSQAIQIINVSYPSVAVFNELLKHINAKAVLKQISEHEFSHAAQGWQLYTMGLGKDCHGIKLKRPAPSLVRDARDMLPNLKSQDRLTAAYCQSSCYQDLELYLLLFSANKKLSAEQDIYVYLSTENAQKLIGAMQQDHLFLHVLQHLEVNRIEWVSHENETQIMPCNPNKKRVIKILYDFYLDDEKYQALYQNIYIAFVSGDNTLEHAISNDVLPFYRSYNYSNKGTTLYALRELTKDNSDFQTFFQYVLLPGQGGNQRVIKDFVELATAYAELDLDHMIRVWPRYVNELHHKGNFYSSLESIFLEKIQLEEQQADVTALPTFPQIKLVPKHAPGFFSAHWQEISFGIGLATIWYIGLQI